MDVSDLRKNEQSQDNGSNLDMLVIGCRFSNKSRIVVTDAL